MKSPIVLSFGGGVNSTAILVGIAESHPELRPDLILFADTGGEKPETYAFIDVLNEWLDRLAFPTVTIVRYVTRQIGEIAEAGEVLTLEEECRRRKTLPSIAFGFKRCSQKYKARPQDWFLKEWEPARDAWEDGRTVVKLIGFDAGEPHRIGDFDDERFTYRYPLVEWDWRRTECLDAITRTGLPVPPKSSCFFCPSMRKHEILALKKNHPALYVRAIEMEERAELTQIKGLGRSFAWKDLGEADEQQLRLIPDIEKPIPCMCFDGDAE